MKLKLSLLTAATMAAYSLVFFLPQSAHASHSQTTMMCRDCPFPMKVADGVWIMPNEKIELTIEKVRLPSRFEEVHVTLRDPDTHEILAQGMSKQKRGRKTTNVQLFDNSGREIKGYLRFIDEDENQIQVKFTCDKCEIGSLLN